MRKSRREMFSKGGTLGAGYVPRSDAHSRYSLSVLPERKYDSSIIHIGNFKVYNFLNNVN
jgi:hypothetical protein